MKTILNIIRILLTIFLSAVLLLVLFQKFTNNRIALGNTYIFQVASESMIPEYKVGDIIVVRKVSPDSLKVGDDVTYFGENLFIGCSLKEIIVENQALLSNVKLSSYQV